MRIRRKLTIDVTYEGVADGDEQQLEKNLNFVASHSIADGLLTDGVGHVKVETHVVRLSELTPREDKVEEETGCLELLKGGNVRGTVRVNFDNLITDDTLEAFLDLLSRKLTETELLCDIEYQVVDVEERCLLIEVEGDPSMIERGPVAKLVSKAECLEKETENQQTFREDMEKAGFKLTRYSGRGMYGQETYAVACGTGDEPDEQAVIRATKVYLRRESLGKGVILYV